MAPENQRLAEPSPRDNPIMLGALGILAYAASMMTHEALGHGGYCLARGGHNVMLTGWGEGCSIHPPGIEAAGPGAQFGAGAECLSQMERWVGCGSGRRDCGFSIFYRAWTEVIVATA
jgi:hypothetical protein